MMTVEGLTQLPILTRKSDGAMARFVAEYSLSKQPCILVVK
jgi:hypothetical protein